MKPLSKAQQGIIDTAFLRATRAKALVRQRGRCVYCKEQLSALTVTADHIYPKSKGGNDHENNILASCSPCNEAKGSRPISEFRRLIKNPPTGSHIAIYLAAMRRRLNKRIERAEKRILSIFSPSGTDTPPVRAGNAGPASADFPPAVGSPPHSRGHSG